MSKLKESTTIDQQKWKRKALESLCTKVTDGTHESPELLDDGVPFVKGKHISSGYIEFENCDFISEKDHKEVIQRSKPEKGDTLLSNIGSVGDAVFVHTTDEFSIKNVALLKPDSDKINPKYLFYKVLGPRFQNRIEQLSSGSAQPFLSLTNLRDLEIEFHSDLKKQKRIASVLSAFDELIDNNKRRIEILEEMAEVIYREWFVNFNFPGSEDVAMKDSDLGPIPENFEIKTIKEACDKIRGGGTPKRSEESYWDNGSIPWFKTAELHGDFLFDAEEKITEEALEESSAKLFPAESVLIAIYGATVGEVAMLTEEATFNQAACAMITDDNQISPEYLYLFLNDQRDYFETQTHGAAQQNLSVGFIKNTKIAVPPEHIMDEFSKLAEPIFDFIKTAKRKNRTLRQTRDLLLPRLISGEIEA